jgi:hypothetical protein
MTIKINQMMYNFAHRCHLLFIMTMLYSLSKILGLLIQQIVFLCIAVSMDIYKVTDFKILNKYLLFEP